MKSHVEPREKQQVPAEIVADLLQAIRSQFYSDLSPEKFPQDRRFLARVVTWPATRLTTQGVTLTPIRYKAIFLAILDGIKVHGETGQIRYWPGYLLRCVQEHWRHHGDSYYEEGKMTRSLVEKTLRGVTISETSRTDPLEALATAAALLKTGSSKRSTRRGNPAKQMSLFD
jgi:predicted DNA-binding transcriptional regulator AlpA